jgi:hypothetical protein
MSDVDALAESLASILPDHTKARRCQRPDAERDWSGAALLSSSYARWAARQCVNDDALCRTWLAAADEADRTNRVCVLFRDGSLELISEDERP